MNQALTEQEKFWKGEFGAGYMQRNTEFDLANTENAWRKMLRKAEKVQSVLECGSNIGRNLRAIQNVMPKAKLSLIEINEEAYGKAVAAIKPDLSFNGPILQAPFPTEKFDLTFSCGVLIHIAPETLLANLKKIYDLSSRYIILCEYFSRTPQELTYHGEARKLFKRDFGKYFMENFSVDVLDYGFLWSQEYEVGGFDDMTWWLFEKKA